MAPTKEKIETAIRILREQGHIVEIQPDRGKTWFEIDHRMRASAEEMQNLADGFYSLPELEEIFLQRRIEQHKSRRARRNCDQRVGHVCSGRPRDRSGSGIQGIG